MPTAGKSTVIPGMRYRDAPAAIDWLCRVLGFSKNLMVPGEGDTIAHAQLTLGDGMVMLGSERDDAHGELMSAPGPGGANTQSAYVVVDDPEAVHERAACVPPTSSFLMACPGGAIDTGPPALAVRFLQPAALGCLRGKRLARL